jgi:hypothetical protein
MGGRHRGARERGYSVFSTNSPWYPTVEVYLPLSALPRIIPVHSYPVHSYLCPRMVALPDRSDEPWRPGFDSNAMRMFAAESITASAGPHSVPAACRGSGEHQHCSDELLCTTATNFSKAVISPQLAKPESQVNETVSSGLASSLMMKLNV